MVDWQAVFCSLVALALGVGGYFYKDMKNKLEDLSKSFFDYKVHVSEHYVKNTAFDNFSGALFAKLGRISDKLDGKQDKV